MEGAKHFEFMSKSRSFKNLLVAGSSYFLFYSSFQTLQNLQSTINADNGRGMQAQTVIYAVSMVSSLLLPDLLIKTWGAKRTLVGTFLFSLPFLASNYYPLYEIIIPSSVVMGIGLGPVLSVYTFYGNEMAYHYFASRADESLEVIISRFNGILAFFMENTQIWGNLISSYVLNQRTVPIVNATNITCGIDFINQENYNQTLDSATEDKRVVLVSIFIIVTLFSSILLGGYLDGLGYDIAVANPNERCRFILYRLCAAIRHACLPHQVLITPLSIFVGIESAFYVADFTQAYIACSWGLDHIGFVTVCLGVCGAFMALSVGTLVKYASQMAVIFLGACINVGCCISLYLWDPSPEYIYKYFLFAGFWGMADAIWWSQLGALYGLMFPNDREAAFSNLYFWTFLGFTLSFSYANSFTVATKITILLCFLITGIVGYFISQVRIRCYARREYLIIGEEE